MILQGYSRKMEVIRKLHQLTIRVTLLKAKCGVECEVAASILDFKPKYKEQNYLMFVVLGENLTSWFKFFALQGRNNLALLFGMTQYVCSMLQTSEKPINSKIVSRFTDTGCQTNYRL